MVHVINLLAIKKRLLMSRTASTNDPDDSNCISTTGNYLCVQPQNESYRERANSFNSRIEHRLKDSKNTSSGRSGRAIKFFSLRKMIKGEKNDQLANYDAPSTLMLTSSLANSLTVSSTTNSFETTSSKSSSKSSFLRTLFNSTLLSSSSASSIRSTNSTPTNSPLSKSNSSQSLISNGGPITNLNSNIITNSSTNELQLPSEQYGQSTVGEANESQTCSQIDQQHSKKSFKNRNRKKIDTLSACFRARSTSISGGLLRSEVQMSSTDDVNRLIVSEPVRTLKQTLSLDQDQLVSGIDDYDKKQQQRDEPIIMKDDAETTGCSLLMESINKEDEMMRMNDGASNRIYLNTAAAAVQYESADLVNSACDDHRHCFSDNQNGGDAGKREEQQQLSCSEELKREIILNKGDRTSTVAQYQSANRSDERTSLKKKFFRIQYLNNNSQLNKSKSANDLGDSTTSSQQSKQIRSNSANQLPNYDKSSFKTTEQSIAVTASTRPQQTDQSAVEQQCSPHKSPQKVSKFDRLRTLISNKGLNRTKKERFRDSLNNQSANSIEQLLFHEQCKYHINKSTTSTNSCQLIASGLKNEIKMKFRRSDADYNLTKSMKTVDHKDLTLMQILALKPIRSKLKSHHQDKQHSDSLFQSNSSNNKKLSNQRNSSKLFNNNKMVLPELSSSPVCAENVPDDCFADSAQMYGSRKSDHHISFTSKFMSNENNSFTCDENISKNEQDIYKQPFSSNDDELLSKTTKKDFHQCDKQVLINDTAGSMTSVNTNSSNCTRKWIQLAGHEQSFFNSSKPGIILKKNEQNELTAYKKLNEINDQIIEFIPKFYSVVKTGNEQFIELQDLLSRFDNKCNIIDLKMGTRTFLETDVTNVRARPDLYEKLIKIDSSAATQDEHQMKAITKLRYMTFRENLSSSSSLGFRIEGFRCKCNGMIKDFKYLRKEEEVKKVLSIFMPMNKDLRIQLLRRLKLLKARFKESDFFRNHEVIGSSLLIIHDDNMIGVWMIDFGRTVKLPDGVKISHDNKWSFGNHEDGYLTGLNNLIRILKEIN